MLAAMMEAAIQVLQPRLDWVYRALASIAGLLTIGATVDGTTPLVELAEIAEWCGLDLASQISVTGSWMAARHGVLLVAVSGTGFVTWMSWVSHDDQFVPATWRGWPTLLLVGALVVQLGGIWGALGLGVAVVAAFVVRTLQLAMIDVAVDVIGFGMALCFVVLVPLTWILDSEDGEPTRHEPPAPTGAMR